MEFEADDLTMKDFVYLEGVPKSTLNVIDC